MHDWTQRPVPLALLRVEGADGRGDSEFNSCQVPFCGPARFKIRDLCLVRKEVDRIG